MKKKSLVVLSFVAVFALGMGTHALLTGGSPSEEPIVQANTMECVKLKQAAKFTNDWSAYDSNCRMKPIASRRTMGMSDCAKLKSSWLATNDPVMKERYKNNCR